LFLAEDGRAFRAICSQARLGTLNR
jgi:hypothetical protein